MSEFPGIETVSGHLDFGHAIDDLVNDVHIQGHDHSLPASIAQGLPKDIRPDPVEVARPSVAHFRTYVLDGNSPTEVTLPYARRANLTVTCQAGGPVRLGADNEITTSATDAKSVALPTGASRTFSYTGKVFAHGPANAVVDIVEEHYS